MREKRKNEVEVEPKKQRRVVWRYLVAGLLLLYLFCLPRELFHLPYSTLVTDRDGELLGARIADDGQWRFPPREELPEKYAICLIQFEDRHFYRHFGVNLLAIIRAADQNRRHKRVISGGSTLTMQTIRLSRNRRRTFGEKIKEALLATRLELRYSKQRILALYASYAPFGGNVVGLDAAAWRYFGHAAEQLSWAEAATLAVLPNAPSMIHLSKSRDRLLDKRNRLLTKLLERGLLTPHDYELAISEELPGEPLPLPQTAPHLVNALHQTRQSHTYTTTIDRGVQQQVEELLERWRREFDRSDIRNLAALVADAHSGEVLAYCGNVDFFGGKSGNQVDIIRAPRSTGSILKPFLYCAMLQEGELLPHTLVPDIPINYNGFSPQNFNLSYEGAVPASQVIARSLNIPSVQMLQQYSVPKFYEFLKRMGLTTLSRPSSHYGLSLVLGGAEATLWDVTNGYLQMTQRLSDLPISPLSTRLSDRKIPSSTVDSPFRRGAVWQTYQALKEVNRPEEIDWQYISSMQTIAWKTGTSHGFRDAWAVGSTQRYIVAVWVGNSSGEGKPGLVGARTAGPVMFDLFNLLPSSPWFTPPMAEFTEAVVCRRSGHLAGRFCDERDTVAILPAGTRSVACPYHHPVVVTPDERWRINAHCAGEELTVERHWFTLPPAWEWYYKQHHADYRPLPPYKAGCGEGSSRSMQFIYPQTQNAQLFLPKQLDGSEGEVTFELAHSRAEATVFWHLDEQYVGQTCDFHKLTLRPTKGKHQMTVVDDAGNSLSITFTITGN